VGKPWEFFKKVRTDTEKLIIALINIVFTSLVGVTFVFIYAINIHWSIALVYISVIPVLGVISSVLSKKIKIVQKTIVSETTALAGSTTESLRNIELVKSLGLSGQEIKRLNATTDKILKLELKKVKYVRSLSFIQGTLVNLLRNMILLLMLYLIFAGKISVGEFFSLFIYSFFIFGPLQELGNIINIYRETEVSLDNFKGILNRPKEKKPLKPAVLGRIVSLKFNSVSFKHQSANRYALENISFETQMGPSLLLAHQAQERQLW